MSKAERSAATRRENQRAIAAALASVFASPARLAMPVLAFEIDLTAAAAAMLTTEADWLEQLGDGRKASGLAESWVAQCVRGETCPNKNEKGHDATHPDLGKISVKCLTKSKVCFEMSVDVGAGRGGVTLTAAESALPASERSARARALKRERTIRSISQAEWHGVVDIRQAPLMKVIVVPASWLLAHCDADTLDSRGWSGEQFYRYLDEAFEPQTALLGHRLTTEEESKAAIESLRAIQAAGAPQLMSKASRLSAKAAQRDALREAAKALKKQA